MKYRRRETVDAMQLSYNNCREVIKFVQENLKRYDYRISFVDQPDGVDVICYFRERRLLFPIKLGEYVYFEDGLFKHDDEEHFEKAYILA